MSKYQSIVGYCQYAIASDYLGCYRVFIVPGTLNAEKIAKNNYFIRGEVLEKDDVVLYKNVKDAVRIADELNEKEGLDAEQCYLDWLPQIRENLQSSDKEILQQTSVAIYKFIDDCHYADKRWKEYYKLKKVIREYYS